MSTEQGGGRVWGRWVRRTWQNTGPYVPADPRERAESGSFCCRRSGVKEDCGWGPSSPEAESSSRVLAPPQSHPAACPSPHSPPDHQHQAQKGRCAGGLLTHLSQASVQMPRGGEGWAGPCPGPLGEVSVARRDSHRLC